MELVKTGVEGLDRLIGGGFQKGSSVLVSGPVGSGKTTFCCQYVWEGLKNNENCMFISFEEGVEEILKDAQLFSWDFRDSINKRKLIIYLRGPMKEDEVRWLAEDIRDHGIGRVVIDPSSMMLYYYHDLFGARRFLAEVMQSIKEAGATSVFTSEVLQNGVLSRLGVEEFIADAIISFSFHRAGKAYRSLQVRKMRRQEHKAGVYPFSITRQRGIVVE